jgi:hypothetical protein
LDRECLILKEWIADAKAREAQLLKIVEGFRAAPEEKDHTSGVRVLKGADIRRAQNALLKSIAHAE